MGKPSGKGVDERGRGERKAAARGAKQGGAARGASAKGSGKAAGASAPGPRHVALLRGINVGGKNMLPMAALKGFFEGAGCRDVRTYINSGNVVFEADGALAGRVAEAVGARVEKEFGFRPAMVVRAGAEVMRIASAGHPFAAREANPKLLHVGFLAEKPGTQRLKGLDPERSPGDVFEVRGREIYLCLRAGAADTKLTNAYFDSALGLVSTFRNWRTVEVLAGMCAEGSQVKGVHNRGTEGTERGCEKGCGGVAPFQGL